MVYRPSAEKPAAPTHITLLTTETDDSLTLEGWYSPPETGNPVVLFFHGNTGDIGDRLFKMEPYIQAGYGVLLAGYRGYGGNPGDPSEEGLYRDARAWVKALHNQSIFNPQIILYGESLGSGVAVQMAVEYQDVKGLVLEAPYTKLPDIGARQYPIVPVNLLMTERFESINKIGSVSVPVLIFHGTNDDVIPFAFGKRLFEAARDPKHFIPFEGLHHNDLPPKRMFSEVHTFLH